MLAPGKIQQATKADQVLGENEGGGLARHAAQSFAREGLERLSIGTRRRRRKGDGCVRVERNHGRSHVYIWESKTRRRTCSSSVKVARKGQAMDSRSCYVRGEFGHP